MNNLTEEEKAAMVQRYQEGVKLDDIQQHFGINLSDVYTILGEAGVTPNRNVIVNPGARRKRKAQSRYQQKRTEESQFTLEVSGIKIVIALSEKVYVKAVHANNKSATIKVDSV